MKNRAKPNRMGTVNERWAYLDRQFTIGKVTLVVVIIVGLLLKFVFKIF